MAARLNTNPSDWTDKRVERLTELWNLGWSASQIARDLTAITRNAVIGKVTRLGLLSRSPATVAAALEIGGRLRPRENPRGPRAPKVARVANPFGKDAPSRIKLAQDQTYVMPESRPLPEPRANELEPTATIDDLGPRSCKWPIGDPSHDDFGFCGRLKPLDEPYCAHHRAIAWAGIPKRRTEAQKAGDEKRRATYRERLAEAARRAA